MLKSIIFILISLLSLVVPPSILAAPIAWTDRCVGTGDAAEVATIQGFECLFSNVLQVIVGLAGLIFFFIFISGGFKYLFSSGDEKKVAAASSTLTSAILGLVGVIASWFILKIIEKFTGVTLTDFIIPGP